MIFVRHPKRPGWGNGRVLREIGDRIQVYFESVGPKLLVAHVAGLVDLADDEVGPDDLLRHLKQDAQGGYSVPPLSFEDMVQNFLRIEQGGFDHPRYINGERVYKEKAVALAKSVLSRQALQEALDRRDYTRVFEASVRVAMATNLIHPRYELPRLRALALTPRQHEPFATSLGRLLLADRSAFAASFEALADTFLTLNIGTWPISSYWMFILHPEEHLAVKPMFVNRAAAALGYDIGYDATPSAKTYARILSLAGYVREKLVARGYPPKDMIDVQGFLWIGAGGADRIA
jgi:hypothetical protein